MTTAFTPTVRPSRQASTMDSLARETSCRVPRVIRWPSIGSIVSRNFQYVNIRSQLGQERHQAVSVARQFDALIEAGGVTHESSKVRV